jgi:hypothetical protein
MPDLRFGINFTPRLDVRTNPSKQRVTHGTLRQFNEFTRAGNRQGAEKKSCAGRGGRSRFFRIEASPRQNDRSARIAIGVQFFWPIVLPSADRVRPHTCLSLCPVWLGLTMRNAESGLDTGS